MAWQLPLDPGTASSRYGIDAKTKHISWTSYLLFTHEHSSVASWPSFCNFTSSTSWAWVCVVKNFSIRMCDLAFIFRRACLYLYLWVSDSKQQQQQNLLFIFWRPFLIFFIAEIQLCLVILCRKLPEAQWLNAQCLLSFACIVFTWQL